MILLDIVLDLWMYQVKDTFCGNPKQVLNNAKKTFLYIWCTALEQIIMYFG